MNKRIMIDTNALIRYLGIETRNERNDSLLSLTARDLLSKGFAGEFPLFLSSVSIIEIWANIIQDLEVRKNLIQVVKSLYEEENLRVVELSTQTIHNFLNIPSDKSIKEHDKIIFSCALEFECDTIITSDTKIIDFCRKNEDFKINAIS